MGAAASAVPLLAVFRAAACRPVLPHHLCTPAIAPSTPHSQTALTEGLRTLPQLVAAAERVVGEATEALLEVELTEEAAMECLRQAMPGVQRWVGGRVAGGAGQRSGGGNAGAGLRVCLRSAHHPPACPSLP